MSFDFEPCSVVWEHRVWAKTGLRGQGFGVELVGEKGTLVVDGAAGTSRTAPSRATGAASRRPLRAAHLRNFLDCIASGKRPAPDIEVGHHSTRLCHLGNIAYRLGRTLRFDATTQTIPGDAEANRLLARAYRKGFELPDRV